MPDNVSSQIPDGGTLRRLPSGLEIVRRKKHESINFENVTDVQLARLTGKVFGSKFASTWTLDRIVNFIDANVQQAGWTPLSGPLNMVIHLNELTGFVRGKSVAAMRIVSDGRYVHAFPVQD